MNKLFVHNSFLFFYNKIKNDAERFRFCFLYIWRYIWDEKNKKIYKIFIAINKFAIIQSQQPLDVIFVRFRNSGA
jgi:hypothetical protein